MKFGNEAGYGLYWFVIESLYEADGYLDGSAIAELAFSYSIPTETVQTFVDYCVEIGLLFKDENRQLFSPRILSHLAFRKERSESGKRGALAKWKDKNGSANGSAIKEPIASKVKNSKEKKRKEQQSIEDSDSANPTPEEKLEKKEIEEQIHQLSQWQLKELNQHREVKIRDFTDDAKSRRLYTKHFHTALEKDRAAFGAKWSKMKKLDQFWSITKVETLYRLFKSIK